MDYGAESLISMWGRCYTVSMTGLSQVGTSPINDISATALRNDMNKKERTGSDCRVVLVAKIGQGVALIDTVRYWHVLKGTN